MARRIISFILSLTMLLAVVPPTTANAAKSRCTSDTCDSCNVECTFNPKSVLTWGDKLEFSGRITSDSNIQKVTVKAFDIDNPDKYVFQTYTKQSVGSKSFKLSNVPDFTAGESKSKNWDGVTIVIYVVLSNETGVHHEFEYDIEFEDLDTTTISSPDEDDTFYAGDDITFKWGSVSGAEEFEWEFYEGIRSSGHLLDSGSTGTTSTKRKVVIDGDLLKAGKAYSFYVRATNDYSDSNWEWISLYAYAKPSELYADPEELSFTKDGGYDYIDLTSSHDWTATVSDGWIKLSDDSGTGDEEIKVTVSANTGASRVGVITFKSEVGTIYVNVIQAKGEASKLDVSTTRIQTSYEKGYESFSVTSNLYDWKVSSNVDWLSVTSAGLDLNDNVKISVDENKSIEPRTGTITVSGGGITRIVTVTQEGRPAIVGDINGDGEITNKDRFLLNRYIAGISGYTNIQIKVADINSDGTIDQTDADYLTNHLAGIKGYESFPMYDSSCAHTNCTVIYAGKTVFVNNTNKNDGVHSYYHIWSSICNNCGENFGEFQGDDDAIKGAIEKKDCTYNFEGYCSCGALDTSKYDSWKGYNATDKTVTVYETPYSSDWYGSISKNEQVTVLGVIGDKYFIKYIVTATNSDKYGYVPIHIIKNSNMSNTVYSIEFDFETITLPVSGRTVLLIPKDGSGFFSICKNGNKVSNISTLKNLKLDFSKNNVECKGTTLVGGKNGGYGRLTVSFEDVDGTIIYVSAPSGYIVTESSSVYTSNNKAVFNQNEKEYIKLTLDMALSGANIKRPRDADFTYGDNVLLNIEKVWDMIASFAKMNNPTIDQCSAVIATYLESFNDGTIGKYEDASFLTSLGKVLDTIFKIESEIPYEEFSDEFVSAIKTIQSYKGKKFNVKGAKDVLKNLKTIFSFNTDVKKWFEFVPDLAKTFAENGCSVKEFLKTIDAMSKSEKFFNFMEMASFVGDAVEIGTDIFSAGCILFGVYDKQLSLLKDIREVLIQAGYNEKDVQIKAIDELIMQYDSHFIVKLNEFFVSIQGEGISKVIEIALGNACPIFGVLLSVAQVAAGNTTASEEAEYSMFRLISHAYICSLTLPYEMFSTGVMTHSLDEAKTMIKLYITMALHENALAIAASGKNGEFSISERELFKSNINHMKKVYAEYLV